MPTRFALPMKLRPLAVVALLGVSATGRADQIAQTNPETYVSSHGRFRLTVFPAEIQGGFLDLTHRRMMVRVPEGKPIPQATAEATLERWAGNKYEQVWRKPLVNLASPESVLVSARDGSFVTFDDWGHSGHGENVVVFYSATGELVKKLALEDILTEAEISQLPASISTIRWAGHHILIDSDKTLLLRVAANGEWDEDKRRFRDIKLRMRDGALIKTKDATP
jgi:hypothetical protein